MAVLCRTRVLLMLALLTPACRRPAEPPQRVGPSPPVRVIALSVSGGAIGTPFGDDAAQASPSLAELNVAAEAGLKRSGVPVQELMAGQPSRPRGDYQLKLELGLTTVLPSAESEGRGLLRAAVRGRLLRQRPDALPEGKSESSTTGDDLDRLDQEVLAEKIVPDGKLTPALLRVHGARAVEDTAAALAAQLKLMEADEAQLMLLLQQKDSDNDLRGVAIRLLGLRKVKAAVPLLAGLLRDHDTDIRDKAIGALLAIGDRSAVKPMASSAQFSDTYELGKILEAVAQLGGDEARTYLSFVAAGHQSAQIREEARVALTHLDQHEKQR